jgi:chromosome segregation ATPase
MEERFIERRFEAIDKGQADQERTLEKHTGMLKEQDDLLTKIYTEVGRANTEIGTLKGSVVTLNTRLDRIEAAMATKEGLATLKTAQDARFDQLEAARDEHNRKLDEQHEMLRQILRLMGQQPDQGQS